MNGLRTSSATISGKAGSTATSVSKPSDDSLASQGEPALATLAHVRSTFESMSAPAIVVANGSPEQNPDVIAAIGQLEQLAEGRGLVNPPYRTSSSPDGAVVAVELPLSGFGEPVILDHKFQKLLAGEIIGRRLGLLPKLRGLRAIAARRRLIPCLLASFHPLIA